MNIDLSKEYEIRKANVIEELKTLYLDTYEERFDSFTFLLKNLDNAFSFRKEEFKHLDYERYMNPAWFNQNNSYGMTVYLDDNENNLSSMIERIDYLTEFDISFVNIMPLLKPTLVLPKQGALPEFISVDVNYGSMSDLFKFCAACRAKKISVCFDNIGEYCKPENIEKVLGNPVIFNKLVYDMLMFANLGVDIFKINSNPYKWSELGLDYPYPDQRYHVVRMLRLILDIVCPGCILLCNGEYDIDSAFTYSGSLVNPECQLINNESNKRYIIEAIQTNNILNLRKMLESLTMISRSTVFLNYIQNPWDEDWKSIAQLCGMSEARDRIELEMATDFDMMLHGYLMMIPGVPFMHLGDELCQNGGKSVDWSKAKMRFNTDSSQYKIFNNLMHLKRIRTVYDVFSRDARVYTYDTFEPSVLGIVRTLGEKKIIGLFNFSPVQKTAWVIEQGAHTDILTNDYIRDQSIHIKPYGMMWLYNQRPETLEDY